MSSPTELCGRFKDLYAFFFALFAISSSMVLYQWNEE